MARSIALLVFVAAVALGLVSCSDEDHDPIVNGKQRPEYADLSQRDHVLLNLQRAYHERYFDHYARILDDGFIFHFSPADISSGKVGISQWDRAGELRATQNIFDPNYQPPGGIRSAASRSASPGRRARRTGRPYRTPIP